MFYISIKLYILINLNQQMCIKLIKSESKKWITYYKYINI